MWLHCLHSHFCMISKRKGFLLWCISKSLVNWWLENGKKMMALSSNYRIEESKIVLTGSAWGISSGFCFCLWLKATGTKRWLRCDLTKLIRPWWIRNCFNTAAVPGRTVTWLMSQMPGLCPTVVTLLCSFRNASNSETCMLVQVQQGLWPVGYTEPLLARHLSFSGAISSTPWSQQTPSSCSGGSFYQLFLQGCSRLLNLWWICGKW